MVSILLTLSLICPIICMHPGDARETMLYHPLLAAGDRNMPGIKFRLTKRGAAYLNELALAIADQRMIGLPLPYRRTPIPNGNLTLFNITVTRYRQPRGSELLFVPPDMMQWSVMDTDVGVRSTMDGNSGIFKLRGNAFMEARRVNLTATSRLSLSIYRAPQMKLLACNVQMGFVDLKITGGGLPGDFINNNKAQIINEMRPDLEKEVCRAMDEFVSRQINAQLRRMPTKVSLADAGKMQLVDMGRRKRSADDVDAQKEFRDYFYGNNMWIDYTPLRSPVVTPYHIELQTSGEVSRFGMGGTPFGAERVPDTYYKPTHKMLYITMTDYVPNSLMYAMFKSDKLTIHVTPDDKRLGKYMKTSCNGGLLKICLGDAIPGLAEEYPNMETELLYFAKRAPTMVFTEALNGSVSLDMVGLMFVFVRQPSENGGPPVLIQTLSIDASVLAKSVMQFGGDKINIDTDFTRFDFIVRHSKLNTVQPGDHLENLALVTQELLKGISDMFLSDGLPLPKFEGLKIIDQEVIVMDRAVQLGADFRVEKSLIDHITAELIGVRG